MINIPYFYTNSNKKRPEAGTAYITDIERDGVGIRKAALNCLRTLILC